MARLPIRGSAFGSLDERRQTLAQVISELGFYNLTKSQEESIRGTLGIAIGQWRMAEVTGSSADMTVKNVNASLRRLARNFENIGRVMSALNTGLQSSHDIELATRLAEALSHVPIFKSPADVHATFARLAEEASLFAQGALVAAELLKRTPSQPGRVRHWWHDTFVKAAEYLCRLNGVRTTVTTDRITGKSIGRMLDVMRAIEGLLPKGMRAPSTKARVQRFYRSKRQLKLIEK